MVVKNAEIPLIPSRRRVASLQFHRLSALKRAGLTESGRTSRHRPRNQTPRLPLAAGRVQQPRSECQVYRQRFASAHHAQPVAGEAFGPPHRGKTGPAGAWRQGATFGFSATSSRIFW
jgi:hypothetical protein